MLTDLRLLRRGTISIVFVVTMQFFALGIDALVLQPLRVLVGACGGGLVRRDVADEFDWI